MDPRCQFRFLNIQQCWPTSDQDFSRYVAKLTPRQAPTRMLTFRGLSTLALLSRGEYVSPTLRTEDDVAACRYDVLAVCLLTLEFFQDCEETQVRDTHLHPPKPFECLNRPRLVQALVSGLLVYEEELCASCWGAIDELPEIMKQATESLELMKDMYIHLYTRGKLSSKPMSPRHAADLLAALKKMVAVMTPEAYKEAAELTKHDECNRLVTRMRQAFRRYGPDPEQQVYPRTARDYSIALMLQKFGIEAGEPEHIAERLRKRRERAKKSPRSQ
jgi:hypothetical protein